MKVAVLIDQLIAKGGEEQVALVLATAFNADVWTTTYLPEAAFPEYKQFQVYSHPTKSFILSTKISPLNFFWQAFIQTEIQHIFRHMDLSRYDLIISAGGCTKHASVGLKNHPILHYEHGVRESYRFEWLFKAWTSYIKKLDFEATLKTDYMVCNSENTRSKIARYYHIDTTVLYPPVDVSRFHYEQPGEYFLSVQRICPGKQIETQLEAFRLAPAQKLLIAGSAQKSEISYFRKLARLAPDNVTFLGPVSNEKLVNLYSKSKGVIQSHPNEDFGIVPVEAMASGKPVIAVNAGGFKETIIPNKTGILVDQPYVENLAKAINSFNILDFNPRECIERANYFSQESFIAKVTNIIATI